MSPLTRPQLRDRLKFGLAVVWLVFTVALAAWWLIFGLRQAEELAGFDRDAARSSASRRMLTFEGSALIVCLLGGGTALLAGIRRERMRHQAVEEFFAAFTHDLRTSLASMRLQVECLQEELEETGEQNPLLQRLAADAVRIQLQLDNSLFYANRNRGRLFLQTLSLRRTVESVAREFTDLAVKLDGDVQVRGDARALEVVLRNLFQNARVHGGATAVDIRIGQTRSGRTTVCVEDDGHGPAGDATKLGRLFHRPAGRSGTGVGLYISRRLMRRMDGMLTFSRGRSGLAATLELQGAAS